MNGSADLSKNQNIVFQALRSAGKPLSAYEILDQKGVRARGLTAPVTIYRALDKLVDLGLVHRIESLNAFVACDHAPHAEPVAFMICEDCKETIELPAEDCSTLLSRRADSSGFDVGAIRIEVSGRCRSCKTD
ncbi:MAG: hypothetical protein RLZ98_707 [Pseudomonadota bacterium]